MNTKILIILNYMYNKIKGFGGLTFENTKKESIFFLLTQCKDIFNLI